MGNRLPGLLVFAFMKVESTGLFSFGVKRPSLQSDGLLFLKTILQGVVVFPFRQVALLSFLFNL